MIEELKLKSTEKLLGSTAGVNGNIYELITLGLEKHGVSLKKMMHYDENSHEVTEINISLLQKFNEVQNYLSDLYTFMNLFDIKNDSIDFGELTNKFKGLYTECKRANLYKKQFSEDSMDELSFVLETKAKECTTIIIDIDHVVRTKQIELINSMQEE